MKPKYELALFAGAGGGILGGKLLGWRTVCAVELDAAAREKLLARQNDGSLPPFPVWSNVSTFTSRNNAVRPVIRALRRIRDRLIITGGFPCTNVSVAGDGEGLDGEESGLWGEQARIIGEIRPRDVLVENSPALTTRGGLRVVGDLTALGYDCRWGIVSAADSIWLAGTPCLDHLRERMWIAGTRADAHVRRRRADATARHNTTGQETRRVEGDRQFGAVSQRICASTAGADTGGVGCELAGAERDAGGRSVPQRGSASSADANSHGIRQQSISECGERRAVVAGWIGQARADPDDAGCVEQWAGLSDGSEHEAIERRGWWAAEPGVGRMVNGLAGRVDRLTCTGNGQVPHAMALAWEILNRA